VASASAVVAVVAVVASAPGCLVCVTTRPTARAPSREFHSAPH
jgi:hypothetical protein